MTAAAHTRPARIPFERTAVPLDSIDPLITEWGRQLRIARKSPRTVTIYTSVIRRFATQMSISPVSACREDVMDWFDAHSEWGGNTAAMNFMVLRLWFAWLVAEGHRVDHPMLRMVKPSKLPGEPRPVSDGELAHLLAMPRLHTTTRVMILLAALAGLRVAEIARVKGSDVDLSRGVMWVHGKGGTHKTVPLHPWLARAAETMPRRDWWFPGDLDPSKPVHPESVGNTISKAMARAGVSGTPHALRHYFGSALLAGGADLRTVQECMRHASITATQIYTRVPDDRRHEAIATLNPFGPLVAERRGGL